MFFIYILADKTSSTISFRLSLLALGLKCFPPQMFSRMAMMRTNEIPIMRRMKAPPIFSKPSLYALTSSWQFNPPLFHHFSRSFSSVPFSSSARIPILSLSLIGESVELNRSNNYINDEKVKQRKFVLKKLVPF